MSIRTNWAVITGAPCSGKTAVIRELGAMGHQTVPEVARAYIDHRLRRGESLPQIKADAPGFERHILLAKIRIEASMPPAALLFFDRGVPDSAAYFELEGMDPREVFVLARLRRYRRVFLMERLEFKSDRVRSEDNATAARLERLILKSYGQMGYPVIRIRAGSVPVRARRVLEHLE
jgi:predicted ATPase